MLTRDKIFESIKYVVDNSKYVKINDKNIEKVIPFLKGSKKESWLNSDYLDIENFSQEQILMYLILCESLNFCYWDSDIKWKIEYKSEWYSGSFWLFYAISKAIKNGYKAFNFYGIDGNFSEDSKGYGLFDFKRGFNACVHELVGEFDLVIDKSRYRLYKISFLLYRKVKNLLKR